MIEIPRSQANHVANLPSPPHVGVVSRHERAGVQKGGGVIRGIVERHLQPADQIEGTLRERSALHLLESILDENREGRCCMKDLLRVGRFGSPFSSPKEPHCRDAVEGSSHV